MSDTALPFIIRFDTTANRVAFTPTPGVSEQLYIWVDSDDQPNAYYWDGAAWQILNAGGGGSGDVVGPASSVNDNIATFDGITGKLIQDGGMSIADIIALIPAAGITELTGDVTAGPGSGSQAATIANDAVTTLKILDANVTKDKIENMSADTLLGRGNGGGAGAPQEITLGTGLTMAGTVLSASGGSGAFTVVSGTLTDAQIRAMFAVPINIVAAVANTIHWPVAIFLSSDFSAGAYAGGGLVNIYRNGVNPPLFNNVLSISSGTTKRSTFSGVALGDFGGNSSAYVNLPLAISNASAAFTGGNAANTLKYVLIYRSDTAL